MRSCTHLELATHHGGHHAPPALASTVRSASSLLHVRDLLLQLLRLPEEPAQVEALAHHALPAPIPHAAHLGAEDLDRGLPPSDRRVSSVRRRACASGA